MLLHLCLQFANCSAHTKPLLLGIVYQNTPKFNFKEKGVPFVYPAKYTVSHFIECKQGYQSSILITHCHLFHYAMFFQLRETSLKFTDQNCKKIVLLTWRTQLS